MEFIATTPWENYLKEKQKKKRKFLNENISALIERLCRITLRRDRSVYKNLKWETSIFDHKETENDKTLLCAIFWWDEFWRISWCCVTISFLFSPAKAFNWITVDCWKVFLKDWLGKFVEVFRFHHWKDFFHSTAVFESAIFLMMNSTNLKAKTLKLSTLNQESNEFRKFFSL